MWSSCSYIIKSQKALASSKLCKCDLRLISYPASSRMTQETVIQVSTRWCQHRLFCYLSDVKFVDTSSTSQFRFIQICSILYSAFLRYNRFTVTLTTLNWPFQCIWLLSSLQDAICRYVHMLEGVHAATITQCLRPPCHAILINNGTSTWVSQKVQLIEVHIYYIVATLWLNNGLTVVLLLYVR